jgi:hypothetical protein
MLLEKLDVSRYPLTKREPENDSSTMPPYASSPDNVPPNCKKGRKSHIDSGSPDNGESGCRELGKLQFDI